MALTPSTMLPLGTQAPHFSLPDTEGNTVSLTDFAGDKALVVMFICNHCPYVKDIAPQLAVLGRDYADKRVGIVAISSNDAASYPADSPSKMAEERASRGYSFPYLYDESQAVAKAYQAACTPDFFVFDADRSLAYTGRLDETRPHRISSGNYDDRDGKPHGADLRAAIDALLDDRQPSPDQKPSLGCNIKWKPGNAPGYFG